MENKQKEKLRKLGLTDEQVEGVVRFIENQEHFESNESGVTEYDKETNPINISIKEPKAPGSTEFIGIDLDYVQEVYDEVVLVIAYDIIDKELNDRVKSMMKEKLPYYDIKCDEENNTPETVASGHLWVRVTDPETKNYIDLVF